MFEQRKVRIAVPITNGLEEGRSFLLRVNVRYQACTDRECFLPQNRTLDLVVPLLEFNRRRQPD